MIEYKVDLPDLAPLQKLTAKIPALGRKELAIALAKSAIEVQNIARGQAPVRTGALRNAILFDIKGMTAIIQPKKNYAMYVEGGTGVYGPNQKAIVPKQKKVLATKINPGWGKPSKSGYFIIGKSSRGQKPNPFMERTSVLAPEIVRRNFTVARNNIIAALAAQHG